MLDAGGTQSNNPRYARFAFHAAGMKDFLGENFGEFLSGAFKVHIMLYVYGIFTYIEWSKFMVNDGKCR